MSLSSSHRRRSRRLLPSVAVVALVTLFSPFIAFQPAMADEDSLSPVEMFFTKLANPAPPGIVSPGETVSYTITVTCSSLTTICVDATVTDTVPEPLVLQSVTASGRTAENVAIPVSSSTSANSFTVEAHEPYGDVTGLGDGTEVSILVTALLPSNVSSDWDGQTLMNTATVTVSNRAQLPDRPNSRTAQASVLLGVDRVLGSDTSKTATPTSTSAVLGRSVDFVLGATNTSNGSVDELVIQEPADTSSSILDYIEVVGLSSLSLPSGADRVRVDWLDDDGWNLGSSAASAVLPAGVDAASIQGLRFVFSSTTGRIERGATAAITVEGALTEMAASIASAQNLTNTAASWVRLGETSTEPDPATAVVRIEPTSVSPIATKQFANAYVIGGVIERVTIGAQNGGDFPLREMTITEPAPGSTSLAEQGLTFDSWVAADIEWPAGATSAEVSYWYAGEDTFSPPISASTVDTLPAPVDAALVQSIRVTFHSSLAGGMAPGQYASLPLLVLTGAVESDESTVNAVQVDVVTLDEQTATATATDDLTRRTSRVNTDVNKTVTPGSVYGIAGATTLISLQSSVSPLPVSAHDPSASTVGAESLVITDPVDTDADEFWNYFDLTDIVATAVPANTTLTVHYLTDTGWSVLPGADSLLGPTFLSTSIAGSLRDSISAIRFTYQHRDFDTLGTLLNPGFTVQPHLRFALRDELRDGTGDAASPTRTEALILENTVESRVWNEVATPSVATDESVAELELLPTDDGSGDGTGSIIAISKEWQPVSSTTFEAVNARSNDQATARIRWGTAGTTFPSMVISDTASDPANTSVSQTVFDTFDLVRIPAITSGMDARLTFDRITAVELYSQGSGWQAASADPCPANCDGTFPGYTLTEAERAATTGVRLIIEESPTRAARIGTNPAAPPVGSGVAAAMSLDRRFDLVFEVRDVRRSHPSAAVLGMSRQAVYNTGEFGVVDNSVRIDGRDLDDTVLMSRTSSDSILILDQPINVGMAKTWVDGPLGTPPPGTPQEFYPRARMTVSAENTSLSRVDELRILDPVAGTDPFNAMNVFTIVSLSVPSGATHTEVLLTTDSGDGVRTVHSFSRAEALALTANELADVVGIEVVHTGRIESAATSVLVVDTQLREYLRDDADVKVTQDNSATVMNTARAIVRDPGGLCPLLDVECDRESVIEQSFEDTAQVTVQELSYGVIATKGIQASVASTAEHPAVQFDGDSRIATLTLTGRPTGNVRSTDMVFEDITPSFWNAFNFSGFGTHSFATPINRVKVSVLVGVTYEVDGDTITPLCDGSTTLDDCWVTDTDLRTALTLPTLPEGMTTAQIRGIRVHYTRADGAAWERPYNPLQTVRLNMIRRDTLVEPHIDVPSTLYVYEEAAPGEEDPGLFTNVVTVTAYVDDDGEGWGWSETDSDTRQLVYRHRPAEVRVTKTPAGAQLLGATIPYQIAVTNLGTGEDKDLAEITIVDLLPADLTGPMLVFGTDPDTQEPYAPHDVITLTLHNSSGAAMAAPSFTASLGTLTESEQPLSIEIDPAFVLPKAWILTVHVPLQFRTLFEAGSSSHNFALNTATVTSDQPFDRCEYSVDGILQSTVHYEVESCTAETRVWALPSAPMSIIKGVKGVNAGPLTDEGLAAGDDLGVIRTGSLEIDCSTATFSAIGQEYYRFPCVPITRPGGREEWVANFFNAGNVQVKRVVAIDVLPRENDRGVIINDSRGSRWAATLLEYPRLFGAPDNSSMTVYYTDRDDLATVVCNGADIQSELGMSDSSNPAMVESYQPCITSTSNGGLPDRSDPVTGWQVMPINPDSALLESVVALKFVIDLGEGSAGLAPGSTLTIAYETRTAIEPALRETSANLARDSIAYNSIAGAARGLEGGTDYPYRFVLEPRKAGVALATGAIEVQKVIDGPGADFAPGSVEIDVSCTVDIDGAGSDFEPQPISLLTSTGANRSPFTIVGNAAPYRILGIPLYAECTLSEAGVTGATTTAVVNETVKALAVDEANPDSLVFSPQPAFGERAELQLSQFTNTYELAGLTISKTVQMNGAVNANGDAVIQNNFQFSVNCTFDNGAGPQSVLAVSQVTLNHGQSQTYSGLPAGSICTVIETQARGATVSKVITSGGVAAASTAGATAVVTLSPDDGAASTNSVDYTNSVSVGSLTVTKAITGAAATDPYDFGGGTFTVLVNCTRSNAALVAPATQPTGAAANAVWYGLLTFSKDTQLSHTIDNIPAGSSCAITEQQSAGATQVTNPSNVTIQGNSTVSRTVTNRFDLASLTIGKTVLTDAVDENDNPVYPLDPFEFEVSCSFQGSTVIADGFAATPMSFTLRHAETRTLTGLPAGASCTITETETQEADSTSIVRTVGATSTSVDALTTTITSLAANTGTLGEPITRNSAQFTNRYGVTSFTISKDVIGGGGTQFAPESFTANLVCTAPLVGESFNADVTVPANGFVTIENLADGSTCTVFERNVSATGADAHRIVDDEGAVIDGVGILVTADDPASVTLENYYLTGELEVSKSVIGAGASYGDGPFEVTLACVRDGIAVDIAGGATRELAPDATVSYTLLPSGAQCTLTETDRGSATSSRILDENGDELTSNVSTGYPFTVTVDASDLVDDQPQPALEVENTFELASLAVSKTVSSSAVDHEGEAIDYGPFPVTVDCLFQSVNVYGTGYDAGTPMQRDLADGETWNLSGLPDGASCTVTETDTMNAVETRITTVRDGAGSSTTTSSSAVVTLGTVTTAEIENDYTVGSLELSKAVIGAGTGEWADSPFEIDVTCVLDDSTAERVVFTDSFTFLRGDDAVTIDNLATGALCSITESATGGASSTTVTINGDTVSGVTADVVIADELVEATVTNTFGLGEIRVEKLRDGEGAGTWGAGPFEVELSCVRDIDGVDESIEIPGGALRDLTSDGFYRATYDLLPIDAVCSLVETRTAGATSSSIDVDELTVAAAPVQFTVTNTFDVGSVAIEKTFAGDGTGLFVQGPYEATLACTLEIDTVVTELEIPGGATRELTELNGYRNSWAQIPAGAECSVTETRTGGATRVDAVDNEFTVVADEQHTVSLENTFLLAAFSITKDVTGPFAHEARDAMFLIETECVWERDGELVPLLPGGWPRESIDRNESDDDAVDQPRSVRSEIRHGATVTFDNLPANSVCSVSELDSGGATMHVVWLEGVLQLGDLTLDDGENDSTLANVFMLTLANTGVEIMIWLWVIAALLLSGVVLLTIARQRASVN